MFKFASLLGFTLAFALLLIPPARAQEDGPALTLVATGADYGVIEPCGCTGGQLGGIGRRATLLETLFPEGAAPRMILATGGLVKNNNLLNALRYEIILLCMEEMGYNAAGLGPEELALGLDRIRAARELVEFPLLLTNVTYPDPDLPFQPYLLEEVNGLRILVLALIPESLAADLPREAEFIPPEEALSGLPEADLVVLLLRGTRTEAKALDPLLPEPKIIFYSFYHAEPQIYDFGRNEGLIRYLSPGDRGRFLTSCRVAFNADGLPEPVDPVQEPLSLHYPESELLDIYMEWYRERVLDEGILAQMVAVQPEPPGAPFRAEETCALCHPTAFRTWKESKHAHAYQTLIDSKRAFDPDCLSCHTVGFGFKTGFLSVEQTPEFVNVGCESCHGPCGEHLASAGQIPTPLNVDCILCHEPEHSSSFFREEYWEKIKCLPDSFLHVTDPITDPKIENGPSKSDEKD